MSEPISQKTHDVLRRELVRATTDAAKADSVNIHADALSVCSEPYLLFVNAPIAGVENLDFKALLDGDPVLDDTPVMYWHLSGSALGHGKNAIPAGFYTVVAHGKRGSVSLRSASGKTVAEGDLDLSTDPQEPPQTIAKIGVSGGIDSVKFGKKSLKVCGHVTISAGPASVTIKGCVDVKL